MMFKHTGVLRRIPGSPDSLSVDSNYRVRQSAARHLNEPFDQSGIFVFADNHRDAPDGIVRYFLIRKVGEGLAQQGSALMPELCNFRAGSFALHRSKKNDAKDNIQWVNDPSGISGINHFWAGAAILAA